MGSFRTPYMFRASAFRAELTDSPFIEGQRIYYDYLRPHSALDGKTPAQAAGIELDPKGNKWEAIIKKATENQSK